MDSTKDSSTFQKLINAVTRNNVEDAAILLRQGVDVNERGLFTGDTLLHLTARRKGNLCMPLLIEHGAELNSLDLADQTPLHIAAWAGNADAARLLTQSGADINVISGSSYLAVEIAGLQDEKATIRALLQAGAKVSGSTLLYSIAEREDSDFMLEVLQHCERTGDLNHINRIRDDTSNPLHMSAQMGLKSCVEYLLKLGADPNLEDISPLSGQTCYLPLQAAILGGDIECVRLLLPPVSDIDVINECALSPFYDALERDEDNGLEILKLLLQAGIDVNALHEIENGEKYSTDFRTLWDNGDHDVSWYDNLSALGVLAMLGGSRLKYARLLLDAGARIDPVSDTEYPVLVSALEMVADDDVGLPRLLVDRGASVNLYHKNFRGNMTVLASLNNFEALEFILNAGAEVDSLFKEVNEGGNASERISIWTLMDKICKVKNIGKVLLKLLDHIVTVNSSDKLSECVAKIEDINEDKQRILAIIGCPRSLKHLCRAAVRKEFPPNISTHRHL